MTPFENMRLKNLFPASSPVQAPIPQTPQIGAPIGIQPPMGAQQNNPYSGLFQTSAIAPQLQKIGVGVGGGLQGTARDPYDDYIDKLRGMFQPEHEFSDMYMNAVKNAPQMHAPGKLQRIGAILSGVVGGPDAATKFLRSPYETEMADYTAKLKNLEPGMTAERYSNTNQRYLLNSALTGAFRDREQTRKEAKDAEDRRQFEVKSAQKNARDAAYIWKQMHPNVQIVQDDSGYLFHLDPTTKKLVYMTYPNGLPMKGSDLAEEDKMGLDIKNRKDLAELMHQGDMEEIAARGAEDRKTENVRAKNREQLVSTRTNAEGDQVKTIQVFNPDGSSAGFRTETVTKRKPGSTAPAPEPGGPMVRIQRWDKDSGNIVTQVVPRALFETIKAYDPSAKEVKAK